MSFTPFPARAGMNRFTLERSGLGCSVPRTRGDEPGDAGIDPEQCFRSPHARG